MSIQSEINRIKGNVADAYAAVEEKGGTLPEEQTSGSLAEAISSIPAGTASAELFDPVEVYQSTRPADWLPMPEPADNEMYLLFHVPDGVSGLLAFTATCTGSYTVALGTVSGGQFVQQSAVSMASNAKYEAEIFADDFGDLTSTGMKQVMVKVSGTDINTWAPSAHSKKSSPSNFSVWNIVEIVCRLPSGTSVKCGKNTMARELMNLKYFSWYEKNNVTNISAMFYNCRSLIAIPQLDTSKATNMASMFQNCYALTAIPQIDTGKVTNMASMFSGCYTLPAVPQLDTNKVVNMGSMFQNCYALAVIPQLDTSKVTSIGSMFSGCNTLPAIPQLDTSKATSMGSLFQNCYALTAIPQLDTSRVTSMNYMFMNCYSLTKLTLNPLVAGWSGYEISLADCSMSHAAIVGLFNSLPTITGSKAVILTGNPGVSELTDEEKAIATGKNWTLTL